MQKMQWITPNWPVPTHVKAASTTRAGGVSQSAYDSLNLGAHVGDELQSVLANRRIVKESLNLPSEPIWLEQVHSTVVADADSPQPELTADASVSHQVGKVCVVMTADCLPVLMTNQSGSVIGAAHAGWRGLNDGVLETTLDEMAVASQEVMIWLGPAIGPKHFEVGEEVREAFVSQHKQATEAFNASQNENKWYADIYQLARIRLVAMGVSAKHIYGGGYCTYSDKKSDIEGDSEKFFSYRRQATTGRMASLIWLSGNHSK